MACRARRIMAATGRPIMVKGGAGVPLVRAPVENLCRQVKEMVASAPRHFTFAKPLA